jgi:tetratricopeptide (TPR) repeat protein
MVHVEEVWKYYHSDVDPEPTELQDAASAREHLLMQIDAQLYDEVMVAIESGQMDWACKRYQRVMIEMICRLGKGQFVAAAAHLDDLLKDDSEPNLPGGKIAAIGCLLLMKRYNELQQFLKQLVRGVKDDFYERTMLPASTSFQGPESIQKHQIAKLLEGCQTRRKFQDELYYRLGLEMHHAAERFSESAAGVYKNIMSDSDYMPKFRSWAFFKFGEICKADGKEDQAITSFEKALEIDPSHAKARIALTAGPLPVVEINTAGNKYPTSLRVKMDLFNEELWYYYFEGRKITLLIIALQDNIVPDSIASLRALVKPYMAVGGTIHFVVNDSVAEIFSEVVSSCFAGERYQIVNIVTEGQ